MTKVKARINGHHFLEEIDAQLLNTHNNFIHSWASPVNGTVYGTLLNDRFEVEIMKERFKEAPYNQPPKAPVLYIKPINTLTGHQSAIPLPLNSNQIQISAGLGIVIGIKAEKVSAKDAFDYIEGFTIVNDVSLPHNSLFRPAVKEKARDGFCPVGPWIVPAAAVSDPHNLGIKVFINNELMQDFHTSRLVRTIPELLRDVTEFMTLNAGDLLIAGTGAHPPLAGDGDLITIEIDEVGRLENSVRRDRL
ncbi:fumarylacetoacetate hydrolase family protein [Halobacillus massiliensis]|uniref:fumarylacetoacetate hydrolase family protein n=1 Tax=Halobacillus massiliensis TaxID=1926286 RepID=UPI0009E5B0CB|nr:fumarylacetoacetate hydrolase family protein [Halobacillus massiliensis]